MVSCAAVTSNPVSTLQPAAWRTRCPDCGHPSPYGVCCPSCLATLIAAEKTIANQCPACREYSAFGSICGECMATLPTPTPQPAPLSLPSPDEYADCQLYLRVGPTAPIGFIEVECYIGPDSTDAQDSLMPHEYVAHLRKLARHLNKYVDDYETAMTEVDLIN